MTDIYFTISTKKCSWQNVWDTVVKNVYEPDTVIAKSWEVRIDVTFSAAKW